jgi:predicted ThiF/HesA family dinucleotide-utilizing enzyme
MIENIYQIGFREFIEHNKVTKGSKFKINFKKQKYKEEKDLLYRAWGDTIIDEMYQYDQRIITIRFVTKRSFHFEEISWGWPFFVLQPLKIVKKIV